MSDDTLFTEFLDDYFSECDEHLTAVRQSLLRFESLVASGGSDPALLAALMHHFHTLKGLSGMVGLGDAEQIAHSLEDLVKAFQKQALAPDADRIDLVVQGVRLLEETIRCWHVKNPLPDGTAYRNQVAVLLGGSPEYAVLRSAVTNRTTASAMLPAPPAVESLRPGERLWAFRFSPSHELAERGVNINVVRERLSSVGRLLKAAPLVCGDGVVLFEFLLASDAPEETFASWEADGLVAEPRDAAQLPADVPINDVDRMGQSGVDHYQPLLATSVVRVDLSRLDDLMRIIGDLVVTRAQLQNGLCQLEGRIPVNDLRPVHQLNQVVERQLRELRDGVMRIRMVPVGEIFQRMQFVIRDLSRELGRSVHLEMAGQETEIDKYIVERMVDPLLHLVRNAVGHGIESPAKRAAAGKPETARIVLRAATEGDVVVIEIEDDGRGIDTADVVSRAERQGLSVPGDELDAADLLDILCQPGFSTRDQADLASGRGIGMAVVHSTVKDLGGSVTLQSEPGQGTCFTICLPLTLAIIDALIIEAGGQTFAVPQTSVVEVLQVDPKIVRKLEHSEIFPYRQGVLPLLRLARLYGLSDAGHGRHHVLVAGNGQVATGILVDRVISQQEIVVRVLNDPLVTVRGFSGATELGDGRAVLILDADALNEVARRKLEDKKMAQERRAAHGNAN